MIRSPRPNENAAVRILVDGKASIPYAEQLPERDLPRVLPLLLLFPRRVRKLPSGKDICRTSLRCWVP